MTDKSSFAPSGVRACNLRSAKGLIRVGGEWVALPHKVKATGFKAKNAYGFSPVFQNDTTKSVMEKSIMTADSRQSGRSSASQKKLMPYHPNAPRNRPKESMENTVGTRFGIHPSIKTERYRGSSQVKLDTPGDPDSKRPWKTTNRMFSECAYVQHTTGLTNPGINADIAKRVHKKIGIYGC